MQNKEKIKKEALSLTEKDRKKIKLWFFLIYLFLAAILTFSTFIAIYKHQKAMTSLNKANQIMMTNTGIVIDSVNIKSFQEAELILNEKQKTVKYPDRIRNIFLYDTFTNIKNGTADILANEDSTNITTGTIMTGSNSSTHL